MSIRRTDRTRRVMRSAALQRGVTLLLALIVLGAMMLTGIALVRSVSTGTQVVGNLAFSQAATLPANLAVEEAVAALFEKNLVPDTNVDLPAQNYFATRQVSEDARGIPDKLVTKTKAATLVRKLDGGNGNEIRYVIERMCVPGTPNPLPDIVKYCDVLPPKQSGTTSMETDKIALPRLPLYRLTVRVDGPRNTVSFMQATLR